MTYCFYKAPISKTESASVGVKGSQRFADTSLAWAVITESGFHQAQWNLTSLPIHAVRNTLKSWTLTLSHLLVCLVFALPLLRVSKLFTKMSPYIKSFRFLCNKKGYSMWTIYCFHRVNMIVVIAACIQKDIEKLKKKIKTAMLVRS